MFNEIERNVMIFETVQCGIIFNMCFGTTIISMNY